MFKSLHAYLPGSLDQFLFKRFRSSDLPSLSPVPPRPGARHPQQLISRISTFPTEILLEIFLLVVSSSLSDHKSCSECRRRRHSGSQMLLTHPPSMILSHVCKRWREIMLEYPLLWSFISNQDFCCEEWMEVLLSRLWLVNPQSSPLLYPRKHNGNDAPLLTIRFRACSRQSPNQIGRHISLLRFLINKSSSRIRELSADIAYKEVFEEMFDRSLAREGVLTEDYAWAKRKAPAKWTKNLEELNISNGMPCDNVDAIESKYKKWAVYIREGKEKEEQYKSYLTSRHTPPLHFMPPESPVSVSIFKDRHNNSDSDKTKKPESERRSRVPHLRKLSLTNCYLPERQLLHFKNVEDLVIHADPAWGSGTARYWTNIVYSLPRLRRLYIDGALAWCAREFVPPCLREGHPNFEKRSTNLEELNVNRCSPLGAAMMLRFFTNSSRGVDDQRQRKKWLRKLQITCTNVHYDEEFRELCGAVRTWFNSWNSWRCGGGGGGGGGGGYLYLSIEPSGMVVHNRRVNIAEAESGGANHEAKNVTEEEEPEIQLTLYSHGTLELDLISDMLHLISSPPNEFDATTRPFTLLCEELELSVGLFDLEDDRFGRVFTSFLETFGKVERLRKLRCVGSTTAQVSLSREFGGLALLPMLKSVYFDHVDFADLDQAIRMMSNPPSRVELIKCCNVRREWVSELQRVGTDVLLGRGTSIIEGSEGNRKVEKEPWTSEQVKVTSNKLPPPRTLRTDDNLDVNEQVGQRS